MLCHIYDKTILPLVLNSKPPIGWYIFFIYTVLANEEIKCFLKKRGVTLYGNVWKYLQKFGNVRKCLGRFFSSKPSKKKAIILRKTHVNFMILS